MIEEFRANGGSVGGSFEGAPLLLLNHVGAKTSKQYATPLVYTRHGQRFVILASKGGAPENPFWFNNLVANPDVSVEVGSETYTVPAEVLEGAEREEVFRAHADQQPQFDEYAAGTDRPIPVVALRPAMTEVTPADHR